MRGLRGQIRHRLNYEKAKKKLLRRLKYRMTKKPLDIWERVNRHRRLDPRVVADQANPASEGNNNGNLGAGTSSEAEQIADLLFPITEAIANSAPTSASPTISGRIRPPAHNPNHSILLSDDEIMRAQQGIRGKKYMGPDRIKFQAFTKAFEIIPDFIYEIAKMSYMLCHVPKDCHDTLGNAIPEKQHNKFRIVHVATPLAVFLELIALNRFEYALDVENLRDPNQFGFTRKRGRHDLICKLVVKV